MTLFSRKLLGLQSRLLVELVGAYVNSLSAIVEVSSI